MSISLVVGRRRNGCDPNSWLDRHMPKGTAYVRADHQFVCRYAEGELASLVHFSLLCLGPDRLQNPGSIVVPENASVLLERLQNFHQWSELSPQGYGKTEALFQSCVLDETGKIYSAATSCELTAESYVATAEMYLHCRLLRKPRKHPNVQRRLQDLIKILEYLP